MVVAVVAMRVVQVTADEVVHVVRVRYRLVTAVRTVRTRLVVSAMETLSAVIRVAVVHLETVFVHMTLVGMVQVPVVQVIDVSVVHQRRVPTPGAVLVPVSVVCRVPWSLPVSRGWNLERLSRRKSGSFGTRPTHP